MADSIREQIVKAVIDRCAVLSAKPVGRCVRSQPASKIPAVSVWDNGPDTPLQYGYGWVNMQAAIAVETLFIPTVEADAAIEAQAMYAAIINAVMGTDRSLGGLCGFIAHQPPTMNYPPAGIQAEAVSVVFLIDYAVKTGDPFTAA